MSQTTDDHTGRMEMAVAAPRAGRFARDVLALDAPLLLLAAMALITNLGVAVMVPLIPLYAVSLGASPLQLGLLTSAFAITNAIGQLSVGFLSDRFGARSFIRIGIATYATANALIATAANATMLISYRALAGLGAGFNLVAERIYLAQIADPKRMAFVNAVLSAAVSVGQVAGPAFGGIVTALSDLRAPFVIVSITSGVSFLASLFLPRPEARSGSQAGMEATVDVRIPWRPIAVLIVAQLFLMAGYGAFITTYAPLATSALGWTTIDVGLLFSVFGAGSIILGPWLSHLADRTGRRRIAVLACLPIALFIASLVAGLPRLTLYVVGFAAGGGITAFGASWYALLTGFAPGARRGRIFGIANALSQLGVVFGAMLASTIWQAADLGAAMLSATIAVLLAGSALLALPGEEEAGA
ncbi:MAG TPA: MFS transporter [Anaerolineae bacterium]|nr:MFS transporter [Anaerolineae bacterium]